MSTRVATFHPVFVFPQLIWNKPRILTLDFRILVPTKRLELLRISALPPQDSVSTNSTTTAKILDSILLRIYFGICCGAGFCESAPAGAVPGTGIDAALPSLAGADCITPPPITPLADLGV